MDNSSRQSVVVERLPGTMGSGLRYRPRFQGQNRFDLGCSSEMLFAKLRHSKMSALGDQYSHRFAVSDANAFRTSDCEIPNCRAILDGLMPALKAARTAFNFPCVKRAATTSTHCLRDISTASLLPRRFCSPITADNNRSSSWSSRCLTAFGKSAGRTWREGSSLGDG